MQADVLTLASMGCHPLSVVTAATIQDTMGVEDVMALDPEWVADQARCVLEDMPVTAICAALLTPIFLILSFRVIALRRAARTALGDGGDPVLLRRMRVHANFAEYVPFAIVLIAFAESLRAPGWLLHALGAVLLVGRIAHAIGVSRSPEPLAWRVFGVAATVTALLLAGRVLELRARRRAGHGKDHPVVRRESGNPRIRALFNGGCQCLCATGHRGVSGTLA